MLDADLPIDETSSSIDNDKEAMVKLRGVKTAGICNISAELLKGEDEAMIWREKRDCQDCNNYCGITLLSKPGQMLDRLLLMRIRKHLLKHQRPEKCGFFPSKSTAD